MSQNNGKAGANGTAQEKKTEVANAQTATPQKPELSKLTVSAQPPAPEVPPVNHELMKVQPTIAERLQKFYDLERLKDRRDELTDALDKVEEFVISPTGGGEKLSFNSMKSAGFNITNPVVIAELIVVLKEKYKVLIAEVDAQFIF